VKDRRPGYSKTLKIIAGILTLAVIVVGITFGYNRTPAHYWLAALSVGPGALFVLFRRLHRKAVARQRARERWTASGHDVRRVRYTRFPALLSTYIDSTANEQCGFVDDRTWTDLNMAEISDDMDTCFTIAGRNELRRILRHVLPADDEQEWLGRQSAALQEDSARREELAGWLALIGEETDADPASLLWGSSLIRDKRLPMFATLCALSILSIVVAAAASLTAGFIFVFLMFVINMWVYYRKARHLSDLIPSLRILSRMRNLAPGATAELTGAKGAFRLLLTGAPSASPSLGGDLLEMLLLYLKIYFQIDLLAYERIIAHVRTHRETYRKLYHSVGRSDAAFAIASYRERAESVCNADIRPVQVPVDAHETADPWLTITDAYHPLLEDAVANTISLRKPGAIITGTNMAGKSTCLRTIGINVVLAQTAGFAFARSYSGQPLRLMSSIDKGDDLAEGKSFYFDEAERIYRMINQVDSEVPALLLIDELLSGTNSLERESASIAILHYLHRHNALTVAATHDVTIARGVGDTYALHYFTDSADESGLSFDYRIQEGVVGTRNAIKLLRLIGYPEDVIREALGRTDRS
jgi:hypothetical protein